MQSRVRAPVGTNHQAQPSRPSAFWRSAPMPSRQCSHKSPKRPFFHGLLPPNPGPPENHGIGSWATIDETCSKRYAEPMPQVCRLCMGRLGENTDPGWHGPAGWLGGFLADMLAALLAGWLAGCLPPTLPPPPEYHQIVSWATIDETCSKRYAEPMPQVCRFRMG